MCRLFESVPPVLVRTPKALGEQVRIGHVGDDESAVRSSTGGVPPAVLNGFHKRLIVTFSLELPARKEANETNKAIIEDSCSSMRVIR